MSKFEGLSYINVEFFWDHDTVLIAREPSVKHHAMTFGIFHREITSFGKGIKLVHEYDCL